MPNKSEHLKNNIIEAMVKSMGVVQQACKAVGISRTTFYEYYKTDPAFKDAIDECKEIALDFAESKLYKCIEKEKETSIIFYLKTQGKKRGYIEKSELETNQNISYNISVKDQKTADEINKLMNGHD